MEVAILVDMLVEGRHFIAGAEPEALGHKALAVNLSDLAAMGAVPRYALLAGALPDADPPWLEAFARGRSRWPTRTASTSSAATRPAARATSASP